MEEGRINKNGGLEIKRAGEFKRTVCRRAGILPTGVNGGITSAMCSDDCSLFDEPQRGKTEKGAYLQLCKRLLEFDEFEDKR